MIVLLFHIIMCALSIKNPPLTFTQDTNACHLVLALELVFGTVAERTSLTESAHLEVNPRLLAEKEWE